jgi:microcystin-dependent protein
MLPGALLYIPGGGTFTVVGSPIDAQRVNLVNSGDPNNAPDDTIISGGTLIAPASQRGPLGPAGPTGPQGPPGPQGVSGASAYTALAQPFTIPAVGASAVAFVVNASAFSAGLVVYVAGGDYCTVQSVATSPSQTLTLVNQGYPGGAPVGTIIPAGATISGTGPQGPQGLQGPIGPVGPQGALGVAPTGTIAMYGGSGAPANWLLCDGTAVSRTTFSALFSIISTSYGAGDGTSTFNVPNLKQRVAVGQDTSTTWAATLGQSGGEVNHTLLVAEMAAHTHSVSATQGTHTHADSGHVHYCPGVDHLHSVTGVDHTHGIPAGQFNHAHNIAISGQAIAAPGASGAFWSGGNTVTAAATLPAGGTGASDRSLATSTAGSDRSLAFNSNVAYAALSTVSAGAITVSQASIGSNTPHNCLQPYLVVNYIIKT